MKLKFSRLQRLLTRREYREVYNGGQKYVGNKILIFYRFSQSSNPRLGITITKKWGKAHDRNRFKRVVREGYRTEYLNLPLNLELNIHPSKNLVGNAPYPLFPFTPDRMHQRNFKQA